jgi:hypothetical protein
VSSAGEGGQLELDIVRIPQGQDLHPGGIAEVDDLALGHPALLEKSPRPLVERPRSVSD